MIKLKTGIDVEGFNCSLSANEVRKIFKDHGDPNAEMLRGQRSVTEDDIVNIPIVIQSPSDISLSQKLYNGKPVINFVKNMDGKTTVSAVVSDKHLDLFVQTAFVGIKKGNLATPTGEQAPINTPEASNGTVSTLKVTQPDDGVKRSDRDPDAARVAEVLQKENTKLKEDVKYLKELLKLQKSVTGGKLLTRSSVEAAAGHLMKTTNARGEKAELVKELNSFYEYIAAGEFLTWDGVVENAQPAIKWLQDHMIQKKQVDEYSAGILREIRNSRFHLDDFQKKEVAYYYGSYNNFRKRAMGSFVTIPADYCSFLTQIGNGIIINISPRNRRYIFGIKRPVTKRINRRLKMPFIFEEPYHERLHTHEFELPEDCIDPESEEDNSCERCIHLDDCFLHILIISPIMIMYYLTGHIPFVTQAAHILISCLLQENTVGKYGSIMKHLILHQQKNHSTSF